MTAEPPDSPVSEGVRSLEVRWIFPGQPVCSSARTSPVHVAAWHSENRWSERERTGARKAAASIPGTQGCVR